MSCSRFELHLSMHLDGRLPTSKRNLLREHLEQCERCSALSEELTAARELALQLPTGRKLAAKPVVLNDFDKHRRELDKIRRELGVGMEIAGASSMMNVLQAEAP